MTRSRRADAPAAYELRVEGHLEDRWTAWFDGLTITQEDDGTTSLRGLIADQAELYGLVAKVRDLGVSLVSVTRLPAQSPRSAGRGT